MTNLSTKLVCGAAALLAGATCIGGSVANAETPRARAVSYADLDLSREAGKATLYNRVRAAASTVCRVQGQKGPAEAAAEKRCIENAVDAAMTKAASLS